MKDSYTIKAQKIQKMAETTRSMAKLIQLALVRLGAKPDSVIARKVDLPDGLTLTALMYWLFTAIRNAEKKAEVVLPTSRAVDLIQRWRI